MTSIKTRGILEEMDNQTQPNPKAQSPTPETTPSDQPRKIYSKNWKKLVLIYLIIGAIIYAGVYYFVLSKQSSKPYYQPVTKTVASPTPASNAAAADPTADWKTYTNNKYGLSYPKNWIIDAQPNNIIVTSNDYERKDVQGISTIANGIEISVQIEVADAESTDALKAYYDSPNTHPGYKKNFTFSTLGGLKAVKSDCGHYEEGICYEVIINNSHYTLRYSPAKQALHLKEFDQILSTFKFTK